MSINVEKADLTLKYAALYNQFKENLFEGSADIINKYRKSAFQEFLQKGIPSRMNEDYKYTNLQPSFLPEYQFNPNAKTYIGTQPVPENDFPISSHRFEIMNGIPAGSVLQKLPDGVIFESLGTAAKKYPDIIEKYYAQSARVESDATVALNTALATEGFFIYIPKNTSVEENLQVIHLLNSEHNQFITLRNLILLEPGANFTLVINDQSSGNARFLCNSVTEVFVGENARFASYQIQNLNNESTSVHSLFINQKRDSHVIIHKSALNAGLIRNNTQVILDGENAETNLFGISFPDEKQHVDNFIEIIHAKPHCQSNQLFKNVLNDASSGAFSGRIHVVRDAQKTNAFQRNNNLVLTDKATMFTKPQLIIDADDVKCSHGATIGQIDEDALFYLRARGIDESKARLMMINAFAFEAIKEIPDDVLREYINELIDKKLGE